MNNYMTYAPDTCVNQFTAGQRAAMRAAWFKYRAPANVGGVAPAAAATEPAPVQAPVGMGDW
jgi:hypothetical protein